MLGEAIVIIVCGGLLIFAGFVGFWAGRDSAQRAAFYTISNLRRTVAQLRLEVERADDRQRSLMRSVNAARGVKEEIPEWMQ